MEFGGPDATVLAHHEKAVSYGKQILGELTEASESVLSLITSNDQVLPSFILISFPMILRHGHSSSFLVK